MVSLCVRKSEFTFIWPGAAQGKGAGKKTTDPAVVNLTSALQELKLAITELIRNHSTGGLVTGIAVGNAHVLILTFLL